MARAVLVVARHAGQGNRLDRYRDALNRMLTPANVEPRPAKHLSGRGLSAAVINPTEGVLIEGNSIAIGTLLDAAPDWHVPGAALPDGGYALIRADDACIELAADSVASRTLWYTLTDHEFLVSTSQRALIALLGSFEPNRDVLPWVLSAGSLGPSDSWDTRLKRVGPNERVLLDRQQWSLRYRTAPFAFVPDHDSSRERHFERLRGIIERSCRRWSFDPQKWVLTLSGGTDSRSLLFMLRDRGISTVTWGLARSAEQPGSDVQVARAIARAFEVPHRFLPLDAPTTPPDVAIERFLAVGEGRVDKLSGYVDGFAVWKTLYDEGIDGVIRGDESFGTVPVTSPLAARSRVQLTTLADFFSADERASFELPPQAVPASLERRAGESLATWRDRLYQQFRVPTVMAALTDLKSGYVEVCNPLLTGSVLACARTLPDELRTEKRLWRDLVASQVPNVATATRVAIPALTDFIGTRAVLELMLAELSSEAAASLFSPLLRARCSSALRAALRTSTAEPVTRRESRGAPLLKRAVPAGLRAVVRQWRAGRPTLDPRVLAFRAYLATRMHALLRRDAATRPAGLQPAVNA